MLPSGIEVRYRFSVAFCLFFFSMCACTVFIQTLVLWLRTLYKPGVTVQHWSGNLVEISITFYLLGLFPTL